MLFGGIGSTCGQCVTHPVDIAKIRMQLRGELGSSTHNYSNIPRTIMLIVKNEGPRSIYKGLNMAIIREVGNGSIRTGLYEPIKVFLGEKDSATTPFYIKVASGGSAGLISSTVCTPLDLVKVRMQAWEGKSRSIFWHAQQPYLNQGLAGYYRGVNPTIARGLIVNCA
jgi:hypothetical protein